VQPKVDQLRLHISQNPQKIKKATPVKWICPSWKTISQYFWTPDIYAFIADIQDWIIKKRQAISDPAPNHNEHTDELDLC